MLTSHVLVAILQFIPAQQAEPSPLANPVEQASRAEGDRSVTGLVVTASGEPVAGADVLLSHIFAGSRKPLQRVATDKEGRFQLPIPQRAELTNDLAYETVVLWVCASDLRLAWRSFRYMEPPADPVRLVLQGPSDEAVTVLTPDGKPLVGATVRAVVLRRGLNSAPYVPDELAQRVTARTDTEGRASLPAVTLDELSAVAVETKEFGTQQFFLSQAGKLSELRLKATGRLKARFLTDEPGLIAGMQFRVESAAIEPQAAFVMTNVRVTVDSKGQFEVATMVPGRVYFEITPPEDLPTRPIMPSDLTVRAGELTEVEIPMRPAVRVRGTVRERGTGVPVAGAFISVNSSNLVSQGFKTDAKGNFEGLVARGQLQKNVGAVPRPYICPTFFLGRPIEVDPSVKEYTFEVTELTRGVSLRGQVVDDAGNPVAAATVTADWTRQDWFGPSPTWTVTTSDHKGQFDLGPVEPNAELRLEARFKESGSAEPVLARAGAAGPVVLRLVDGANVALGGRVLDSAGEPVAGAAVEIWLQRRTPDGRVSSSDIVSLDDESFFHTDAEGRFLTPRRLSRNAEYQATVRAEGLLSGQTDWLTVKNGQPESFPDIVLVRLRTVAGRVVDRQGRPVAGATVLGSGGRQERLHSTTDAEGRFRLDGLAGTPLFLFAECDGFRFRGELVAPTASSVELVLTRSDEAPERTLATLPPSLSAAESLTIARDVLEPYAKRAIAEGDESTRRSALAALAAVSPAAVLESLEQGTVADPWSNGYVRRAVVRRLLRDDLDEALAAVESMQDPNWRATGYTDAADSLPATGGDRKRKLLAQALLQARNVQDPAQRVQHFGGIGERLLDLGDTDQATRLLREGAAIARELPWEEFAGFARAAFAEELAQIDLAAALELIEGLEDVSQFDRHHGNIAHELAGKNPVEAERILGTMREQSRRDQWAPRVCYRMAPVDLDRARRIAADVSDPPLRAYALGVMAQALAESNKATAAELLGQSFAELRRAVETGNAQGPWSPCAVAAALLHVAELIDPQLVEELLWRAMWFRPLEPTEGTPAGAHDLIYSNLALMVARYDRSLARTILAPVGARVQAQSGDGLKFFVREFFSAAAEIDPTWAVELIDSLPDDPNPNLALEHVSLRGRTAVANHLSRTDEGRWRRAVEYLRLWVVDEEGP